MKTPVKVAIMALACKFLVTLPLLWHWVAAGLHAPHAVLAGGTALGATVNAAALWLLFKRQDPDGKRGAMLKPLLRIAVAVGVIAMLLLEFAPPPAPLAGGFPDGPGAVDAGLRGRGAAAAYFLCLFLTGHRWRDSA